MRTYPPEGPAEFVICNDPVEASRIQEDIERQLASNHFDEREIFGIKLAVEEALVNAIKHGNRMDPSKRVHIRYHVQPHRFEIGIVDEGGGFDPGTVPDPLAEENLERPSGRGLLLMRHYMDEVVYHPPGNRLTMSKMRSNGCNGCNGTAH
jgi:serine/threonine-protein kinase RsbW